MDDDNSIVIVDDDGEMILEITNDTNPERTSKCPICGQEVAISQLQRHCEECLDRVAASTLASPSPSKGPGGTAGGGPSALSCPHCRLELDSHQSLQDHIAAHELAGQLPSPGPRPTPPNPPQNIGRCYTCGRAGHWSPDCPTRGGSGQPPAFLQQRTKPLANPRSIDPAVLVQEQAPTSHPPARVDGVSLGDLLRRCVEADLRGAKVGLQPGACALVTAGRIEHFEGLPEGRGFDCGYRNLQMMTAYLLDRSPSLLASLYGGRGFVPDMASLQAWIECAWADGFDPPGRLHFGGSLQGGRDWIGTTEVASVLAFFNLDVRIVDFDAKENRGQRARQGKAAMAATAGNGRGAAAAAAAAAPVGIHPGVQCDGCEAVPIVGERFRSRSAANYDLCGACHAGLDGGRRALLGPFEKMLPSAVRAPPPAAAAAGAGGWANAVKVKQSLELWVWNYFEGGLPPRVGEGGGLLTGLRGSGRSPLYFQHEGHSRTIVGIMRQPEGGAGAGAGAGRYAYTLLILDPATRTRDLCAHLVPGGKTWQRFVKRGAATMVKDQYQMLFVEGGAPLTLTPAERHARKNISASELVDISPF